MIRNVTFVCLYDQLMLSAPERHTAHLSLSTLS